MKQDKKGVNRTNDPQTARYIRKQYQKDGIDVQEQNQDAGFRHNPSETMDKYAKKQTEKNIQKQVEYFGYAIEPFHMKNQEMMGQIDDDGFFIFNERGRGKSRDPWLDSIGQTNEAEIAGQLAKKIKTQSRFRTVFEATNKINQDLKQNEEDREEESNEVEGEDDGDQNEDEEERQVSDKDIVEQNEFKVEDLLELMIALLPNEKTNANNYMKKLKAQKSMEQYNRLLTLSNQYIEKTGEYDILTKKRHQLQEMLQQLQAKKNEQSEQLDWNVNDSENQAIEKKQSQIINQRKQQNQKKLENIRQDQDDIF